MLPLPPTTCLPVPSLFVLGARVWLMLPGSACSESQALLDRLRLEFNMPDRLVDEVAWAVRLAQYESLARAGVRATSIAPLLWHDHGAIGLKRATAKSFDNLASTDAGGGTAAASAVV